MNENSLRNYEAALYPKHHEWTPESAAAVVFDSGKYRGSTVKEVAAANDRLYLEWIAKSWMRGHVQRVRSAVLFYLECSPQRVRREDNDDA